MARFRPLALDWKGAGSNPELAPLDPHPAVNVDLEFQSLVRDLKSRNVKGVLISMSSLPNTLFIASQLRVHLPDLILVTTMLHGQWLHPDLTKDMEGLYIFSYHSPHPGKWRMQLTREARPTVRFAPSRIDDRSSPLAQVSTPLVQDAVWLLEHAYFQGHHWGLFEAPDGPSRDLWFLDRSGRWTLRRPLYVSQLRHGQLRPVHVDLEPLPGDAGGPVENPVRFKASGLFGHGQAIATTGSMRVDESYLLLGRFQRICLPLIALGLLLFAVRPSWKLRAGPVDPTSGSLLGMLLAFSALALCGLVSCLHACLWVLKNTGGPLPYLWLETLLLVIAVIAICGLAAGRLAGGFLSLQGAALRGWVKKFKKPILDKLASSTWVPACFFALIVLVPSLLLLDQRIKDVSLQPGKGNPAEGFASFLRVLAGLEPLTGLAYLPPLLAICAFLALAIRFEGQRIFHRQRNALLATPNAAPGAGSNAEPRQWQPVVFSLAIAAILYAPFLFQGGFRATRLLPLDSHRFVELLIGAGFIGIAAYALWQFLKAWRLWRRLKRESIAMEVAPWRGSYPEVGRQYPWRPSRSISPFANDNRSLPFKIFEENLVRDPLSVAPELPAIREGIRELADPGTGKRAEITIVGKLDQILASILQCSASLNTDAEGRLHALYTYLYFRRKLWDVKYRIYLSFAASFGLLFGGAAGLQGSQSLLLVALAGIGVQVALVFRLVLDLEGNGLFSAVAGTVPGKANWNQDTWAALIKPVGLALLALLVASFPGLGAAVAGLILR
jgi:hypothetical protein